MSERFADGDCKLKELHRAHLNADAARKLVLRTSTYSAPQYQTADAAVSAARKDTDLAYNVERVCIAGVDAMPSEESRVAIRLLQAGIIRDIFGYPFRPVPFSPEWRTDTAIAVAHQMYESREFGAMPILADALQDAGCDNTDILEHCRSAGPHVRGCWVVDRVLGKE
jgi:hypothetical protein